MIAEYNGFIRKNTPELVEKLKELGYVTSLFYNKNDNILVFTKSGIITSYAKITWKLRKSIKLKDSFEKEELFLAMAALRNTSDKGAYFKFRENFIFFEKGDVYKCKLTINPYCFKTDRMYYEDLLEYFKNKE